MNALREWFLNKGFVPANKDAVEVYRKYKDYSLLQEMSATIIASWSFIYNGVCKEIDHNLLSVFFYPDRPVYWTIHRGTASSMSLQDIVDYIYRLSVEAGLPYLKIKMIDEHFLNEYHSIQGYDIECSYIRDDSEYFYKTSDVIETAGKINENKRRVIKTVTRNENVSVINMTNENKHICLDIEHIWCRGRDCDKCDIYSGCEQKAMEIMVDLFDEERYKGLFLCEDNTPIGYCIAEEINNDLWYVYFGKANMTNGFPFLMYTMARDYFNHVIELNLNEDMGKPGLRYNKTNFSTHRLSNKHICVYRKR